MKILDLERIKGVLPEVDLTAAIEAGFAAYSEGRAVVPPVGELLLDRGEVHIKYGFIRSGEHYVIKVASGFYENPKLGLPSGHGLMMLFSQRTGQPVCLLLDEGHLTDVRTAVAGAVAAKYLAPREVSRIGVFGTGVQARLQLRHLAGLVDCREVMAWGRGEAQLQTFRESLADTHFQIRTTLDCREVAPTCNLIVTATPSRTPLLRAADLRPGTHVTAVGSDTPLKQELEPAILADADLVVADSRPQCLERGEIHHAIRAGALRPDKIVELGEIIAGKRPGRTSDRQTTVADLTGVAVQDIQIAEAVFRAATAPNSQGRSIF